MLIPLVSAGAVILAVIAFVAAIVGPFVAGLFVRDTQEANRS